MEWMQHNQLLWNDDEAMVFLCTRCSSAVQCKRRRLRCVKNKHKRRLTQESKDTERTSGVDCCTGSNLRRRWTAGGLTRQRQTFPRLKQNSLTNRRHKWGRRTRYNSHRHLDMTYLRLHFTTIHHVVYNSTGACNDLPQGSNSAWSWIITFKTVTEQLKNLSLLYKVRPWWIGYNLILIRRI